MVSVDQFLKTNKAGQSGGKCITCQHKNRKVIERACATFQARRDDRITSVAWLTFTREYLKPKHEYTHQCESLLRHLEKCLGREVS